VYLVDTNVWLERLLDQERTEEVKRFLDSVSSDQLSIIDFSFHSIGVILNRLDRREGLLRFVQDTLIDGAVRLIGLSPADTQRQVDVIEQLRLDFDDAYQYVVAEQYNLTLVSFDSDFDQTPRGRKTPAEILASMSPA
jgi:predicted nucleic acid-binding protein